MDDGAPWLAAAVILNSSSCVILCRTEVKVLLRMFPMVDSVIVCSSYHSHVCSRFILLISLVVYSYYKKRGKKTSEKCPLSKPRTKD